MYRVSVCTSLSVRRFPLCCRQPQAVGLSLYQPAPRCLWSQMLTENREPHQNTKEARECFYRVGWKKREIHCVEKHKPSVYFFFSVILSCCKNYEPARGLCFVIRVITFFFLDFSFSFCDTAGKTVSLVKRLFLRSLCRECTAQLVVLNYLKKGLKSWDSK